MGDIVVAKRDNVGQMSEKNELNGRGMGFV
jgi:hypothetical protein